MHIHGRIAAKSGAVALALLLASAPLASADGGSHARGNRRSAPPPPPATGQAPPLHPGRTQLPPMNQGGGATPWQGRSSGQPLSSQPTLSRGSVPFQSPIGRQWAGAGQPQNNPLPFQGGAPTGNRGLDLRRGSLGSNPTLPGSTNGAPVFGGGRGSLNGGPTPLTLPRPLGGTTPSPSLDTRRGSRGGNLPGSQPLSSYPGLRTGPALGNGVTPPPYATGASSNAAALAALRARAAGNNAQAPRFGTPGAMVQPGGVHPGGVRRSGPSAGSGASFPAPSGGVQRYGPSVGPAAVLPTHTGGVRVEPRPWRTFHRGGRQHWTPDWGYAPYAPVMHTDHVNVFGFPPDPGFCAEPWPSPPPIIVEPTYVYPAPLPPPQAEPPVLVAPPSEPWPAPATAPEVLPEQPPAQADPGADAQAARAETFGKGFEAFQRGAFEEALGRFESLVKSDPKDGEAWMAITHAAFALGLYPRAAEALAQAAALGGFPRGYRFDPAPLYAGEGTFDALLERVVRHVAATPRDADARLVLAWLFVSLGRRVEAQEQLQQVLMLRPDDGTAPVLSIALLPAAPQAQPAQVPNAPAPVPVPAR